MSSLNVLGTPLVDPNDPGIGPAINGVTWTFTVLAIIVVGLRFYLRKAGKHGWVADDWIMLAAVGLQIIWQALATKACQWGLGKDFVNVTMSEYKKLGRNQYTAQIFANFNPLVSRISIAVLLHSLFGRTRRWFSRLIFSWVAFMAVGSLLTNILTLTKSDPIEANWNHTIPVRQRFDPYIQYYVAIGFVCELSTCSSTTFERIANHNERQTSWRSRTFCSAFYQSRSSGSSTSRLTKSLG